MKTDERIPFVDVPPGRSGRWAVERFEMSEHQAKFSAFKDGARWCPAGTYTRLMRDRTVVMSDVPAEKRDHLEPVWKATGRCLVNGLGLGMVVNAMLLRPEVTHLTVVELDPDVIRLVGPHLMTRYGARLSIVQSDAMLYVPEPGPKFGVVWHDIWDHITADNLESMKALHRKYGRRAVWQGSWARWECERHARSA